MARVRNHSALLSKYSLMYERKPRSRVFAPLAETYRKLGMIDESLKILKDGIKNHPSYTLGYVVLANCYYDRQNYEMAYTSLRPFVEQNLENITLQKLFAKTCLNLGHLEEALNTFKNLLLINPKDKYVADQVKLLEDDLLVTEEEQEEIETLNNESSFDESMWVQVDFSAQNELPNTPEVVEEIDDWSMSNKSALENFKDEIKSKNIQVQEHQLDDTFFHEEYDNNADDVILPFSEGPSPDESQRPIITHTLVDLYCEQGHFDRAIDVLKSILELHPDDNVTKDRLLEVQYMLEHPEKSEENTKIEKLKETFNAFLSKVNETSAQRLSQL